MTLFRVFRQAPNRTAAAGQCVPTLYAGKSFEGAIFESILRDMPPLPRTRRVFERDFQDAALAELTLLRSLRVARLFNQELATLGLSRKALIESHGVDAYLWTVAWAAALHRDNPQLDGLAWHSRQQDSELVYVFFGGRAEAGDFRQGVPLPLGWGPGRTRLDAMVATYQVDVVPMPP